MRVRFAQSLVACFVLAFVTLTSGTARAAVITLEFSGTYDTGGNVIFGESGAAVPFSYLLTYDTALDTNNVFIAAGTDLGGNPALHDFYGYSGSGIVSSSFTFGTQTWTAADINPRIVGGFAADFFLDTDLAVAIPTRSALTLERSGVGTLTLGVPALGGSGVFLRTVSEIQDSALGTTALAPMQITAVPVSTPVPEPTSIALLATGLGAFVFHRRRASRNT
jgi:PEP-CTERM motif